MTKVVSCFLILSFSLTNLTYGYEGSNNLRGIREAETANPALISALNGLRVIPIDGNAWLESLLNSSGAPAIRLPEPSGNILTRSKIANDPAALKAAIANAADIGPALTRLIRGTSYSGTPYEMATSAAGQDSGINSQHITNEWVTRGVPDLPDLRKKRLISEIILILKPCIEAAGTTHNAEDLAWESAKDRIYAKLLELAKIDRNSFKELKEAEIPYQHTQKYKQLEDALGFHPISQIELFWDFALQKIAAQLSIGSQTDAVSYSPPADIISKMGGVSALGAVYDPADIGLKASMFAIFKELGLRYPEGIVMHDKAARAMLGKTDQALLITICDRAAALIGKGGNRGFVIRSSPEYSMPGILKTEWATIGLSDEGYSSIYEGVEHVAWSWRNDKAALYRREHDIPDDSGFGIIIQKAIYGNKNKNSCAGVVFSRDPDTGARDVSGRFAVQSLGEDIVSGKAVGEPIAVMKESFPLVYKELAEALKKLEKRLGYPQEIEFTVEDGVLYFLQTRNVYFSPRGELRYIQDAVAERIMTELQALPKLQGLQERVAQRKVFKLREGVSKRTIARGITSIPGAMIGRLAFSSEKARQYAASGPVIIIVTPQTRGEAMLHLSSLLRVGLITTYGNDSSHEAVLTRAAGIPAIVNVQGVTVDAANLTISWARGALREGDIVGIDGSANEIFLSDVPAALVEDGSFADATYGIDIAGLIAEFKEPYLTAGGWVDHNVAYDDLLALNAVAFGEFLRLVAEGKDCRDIFVANIEKHALHELFTRKAREEGKDDIQAERELAEAMKTGPRKGVPNKDEYYQLAYECARIRSRGGTGWDKHYFQARGVAQAIKKAYQGDKVWPWSEPHLKAAVYAAMTDRQLPPPSHLEIARKDAGEVRVKFSLIATKGFSSSKGYMVIGHRAGVYLRGAIYPSPLYVGEEALEITAARIKTCMAKNTDVRIEVSSPHEDVLKEYPWEYVVARQDITILFEERQMEQVIDALLLAVPGMHQCFSTLKEGGYHNEYAGMFLDKQKSEGTRLMMNLADTEFWLRNHMINLHTAYGGPETERDAWKESQEKVRTKAERLLSVYPEGVADLKALLRRRGGFFAQCIITELDAASFATSAAGIQGPGSREQGPEEMKEDRISGNQGIRKQGIRIPGYQAEMAGDAVDDVEDAVILMAMLRSEVKDENVIWEIRYDAKRLSRKQCGQIEVFYRTISGLGEDRIKIIGNNKKGDPNCPVISVIRKRLGESAPIGEGHILMPDDEDITNLRVGAALNAAFALAGIPKDIGREIEDHPLMGIIKEEYEFLTKRSFTTTDDIISTRTLILKGLPKIEPKELERYDKALEEVLTAV